MLQEYKRKQIEEQRQAERLQRQLQQERAYLVSLQQQQQQDAQTRPPQDKKQLYHYKDQAPSSNDKPAWAKEVKTECASVKCPEIQGYLQSCDDLKTLFYSMLSWIFLTLTQLLICGCLVQPQEAVLPENETPILLYSCWSFKF